ncbi:MAG: PIN domain-containing protein [Nanoarchaeota archaeon]|nr:PIN domain-containing protein [Nanoarchaeota archaeon]
MIILDTSIWIEFLKGNFKYKDLVLKLIEEREVLLLECIIGELLQGAKGKREKEIILKYWENLPNISMDNMWIKAGILSNDKKLISKGIGIIDTVIITASLETQSTIWTLDKKLINNTSKKYLFKPID